ncbi:MAG TPA: CDP-alcohol phosphatidyltransferase family protein [Marinobacter sp.]|nr:CDP-alcohol phosphatidyltransferase family protein [Marinobacter sp.]
MRSERWRWIPNALTFMRMVLIVPFAGALLEGNYRLALLIFVIAAISDGIDGFLARYFSWRTRIGAIADPLADKALLITTYLMLTITGVLPVWLFLLVLARDLAIVGGALAYHYFVGRFEMAPSTPGKLNTLVQVLVAVAIMVLLAGWPMPSGVIGAGVWLVAASAVFSGSHYVITWSLRAVRMKQS